MLPCTHTSPYESTHRNHSIEECSKSLEFVAPHPKGPTSICPSETQKPKNWTYINSHTWGAGFRQPPGLLPNAPPRLFEPLEAIQNRYLTGPSPGCRLHTWLAMRWTCNKLRETEMTAGSQHTYRGSWLQKGAWAPPQGHSQVLSTSQSPQGLVAAAAAVNLAAARTAAMARLASLQC